MPKPNSGVRETVVAVFGNWDTAEKAVKNLREEGFTQEEINIISKEQKQNTGKTYDDDVSDGALTGGTIGGLGGLLLGAGALAIPGIGPIIAAGPIAAALGGAVAGGITGGLVDLGIPSEESHRYEQNVARGDVLAMVNTISAKASKATQILQQNGATSVKSHPAK